MQKIIGVAEFQRQFGSFLDDVAQKHNSLVLTRGSRSEVVLVPYDDYLRLQHAGK